MEKGNKVFVIQKGKEKEFLEFLKKNREKNKEFREECEKAGRLIRKEK